MLSLLPILVLSQNDALKIDPLLLVEAKEIWSVIGRQNNPVWPGWDARKTPILVYLPGKEDVLINHPKPPAGFKRYTGAFHTSLGPIWVKDGPTILEFDGQNTSIDVNGVQTLVVADTLSTRRQWVEGMMGALAATPDSAAKIIDGGLYPNPYPSMTIFAHEAFHVYQRKMAPGKSGNELALTRYPSLSVDNNVGFALESDFLAEALRAKTKEEARRAGIRWLAAREARRKSLGAEGAAYEDGTEFNEGLAKYVEYKLLECLNGKKPSPEMWFMQGFQGFDDLTPQRDGLIRQMQGFMSGTNAVNNDLYGASPVRFRLYYSGMAVAAMMDRLGFEWKTRIFPKDASLTGLAKEALHANASEMDEALREIRSSERYADLSQAKEKLAQDGAKYVQETLAKLSDAPGELVLDYSKLAKASPQFSFTPFGILRVDDDRTIFRLIPIRGAIGELRFSEDLARAVLQDRKAMQVCIPLSAAPDGDALRALFEGGKSVAKVELPGVSLENAKGVVRVEGKRVILELSD